MQTLLESFAITILCIALLASIGWMLDITYNVAEAGVIAAWRWLRREVRIIVLRGDIHGYDVDLAYLFDASPFYARAYCLTAARRHAAEDELAALMAAKQKKPQLEEV